ncbi:MAG: hypothetical protein JNK15_22995 [Planctomycetes bacterium]|nr:hypothetical protein [Planctomycetota bacterium]
MRPVPSASSGDAWWPKAQWPKEVEAPVPVDVFAAPRGWERVVYPSIATAWGAASPDLRIENGHLRFRLNFSAKSASEDLDDLPPGPGPVHAEIRSRRNVVQASHDREARFQGWGLHMGGAYCSLISTFDFLPDHLGDHWIRVRMSDRTVWFLVPYGFGCDPAARFTEVAGGSGPPAFPDRRAPEDEVVVWSEVELDLGWLDASGKVATDEPKELEDVWKWTAGKTHVSVAFSNQPGGEGRVTLYREDHGSLRRTMPRTTLAVATPGEAVQFSSFETSELHGDSMRRSDWFGLHPRTVETRTWGLLRVTVEEAAFEWAIPGSLFTWTHGSPQ